MASLDPQELLSHSTWVRRLARSLVREEAEDLVQDSWVAALRSPPHGERGLRPWLRAVVTNAARMRWRTDAHRTAREQAAQTSGDREVPSAHELLERHELQQLLARLVAELREPYRSTILLRFAEGLSPAAIARQLGIPAGTVRWRLKEGLAILRAELDALHRGERRAWMLALAPLARPLAGSTSLVPWIALIAAAAAAVVLVTVFVASSREEAARAPGAASGSGSAVASAARRAPAALPSLALVWQAQEDAPARRLAGRVTMAGAPVPGAVVRLTSDPLPGRELYADSSGRFDFGEQRPRDYVVAASLPGKLAAIQRIDLRDPTVPSEIELVLEDCSASIHGRITDAAGTAIEGAQVFREGVVGTRSDVAGDYTLCVLPTAALVAEIRVVVRAAGYGTLALAVAPPGHIRQDFILAPEAAISGRVVSPDGEPIADAHVALDLTGPEPVAPPERGIALATVSDRDGTFRIAGLAAGEYAVVATSPGGTSPSTRVVVEAAETRSVELRTSATGSIRGRVRAEGRPIGGVTVFAGAERAISQPDGTFVLARVPAGEITLAATPFKLTAKPVTVSPGQRTTVELDVTPMATFWGTVRRQGVPVPFARVDILGPSKAGVTADAAGRYRAPGLEPGAYSFYCDDRKLLRGERTALGEPSDHRETCVHARGDTHRPLPG